MNASRSHSLNFNVSLNQRNCLIDCGIFVPFPLWNILHTKIFDWSLNTPLVSILHLVRKNLRCFWQVSSFNPFVPNAPFLYPLKTYGLISHLLINPSFSGKAQNSTLTPTFTFSRPRTLLGFLSKGLYCRPFQIMFQAVLTITKCAFARFS